MAKYNKAHALSQYVSDLEEERKKRQRLQTSLDEHKQSNTASNTTTVSTKPIAPIRTDTQYIANRILGGQTIEQRYAPFLNVQDRPTTSTDLFNKLKTENEEKLKQQNQNKETDWIDSLKDGYNFGDITKTVLGTVGFGEHSRNDKPIEVDTKAIENMYKNYTEEQLIKEQKNIQNKILTYSKNGVKSPKNKDGKYTLSGVLSMASNENNEKLRNDPEYITLNQIDDVLTEMIQNTRIKNKKYDKGFAGFAEKSTDVLVGGMAKGARGIEGTVKKITGKEDTISEKTYMEKYSDKAMSEANGKVEKALLEMQGSIGQMLPQMVVPAGKASTVLGFANYGGSAYNEAKEQGYTEEQATRYGIVNGTLEMALNKVLPSFKVGGKNIYGKTATDNLTKKIMSKTIGNEAFKRWIIDASGEFTEEYLQEFLDPIVREALLEENNGVGIIKGKNASEIASNIANYTAKNFFSKENFHAGLLGALNSGLMGAPSAFQANAYTKATGRSSETGLTQNEQAVIDNIVENRTEELKKNKDKVTKKDISKIEQEVRQDLERGYIETSEIERALSNEEWTKHDKIVKQKESLQKELDELNSRTMDKITPPEYKRISELEEQIKNIDTDTTRGELNSAMQGKLTENDTLLQRAYGEEIEKNNAYQFDKNEKLTEQTKKINEDIKKLGLNNNIKTRDAIDILKKVSNETGRQYRLVNNNSTEVQTEYKKIAEKIAKMDNISMEEALKQTENLLIDGFVSDGQVFINVESNNLMRAITGHETTHLFEGTEDYKKLQKIAFKYAETKGEYNSRRKSLEKRYRGIENAKIDNELTSDLVGDYLFSDIEFVRNLSTEQPNIFKKMYNYVKHLYNMATAGSKEARQLEQLKYNFEKVYRENNQSKATSETKYSKRLNGFYPEIEVKTSNINKFGINDINNLKEVKEKVYDFYKKKYVSTENQSKPITNIDTGMKIEIWKNGINETFGNANYYKNLSESEKKMKLATMDNLAKMIKYGEIRSKSASNYHNPNSVAEYHYLEHPITIDGVKCMVNIDIRKVPNATGRFYIHSIDTKKIGTPRTSKTSSLTVPISESNIPQNKQKVNSDISTKYSIQNKENNAQELDNSSFSNEKKYRGSHQIENAKAITELSINDIENRVKEVDGYLTKQSESDLRKLKKILNNSNEKVKIYRASPVNELNSGDWVTTDKSYAQNVANNNGGKVYTYEVDAKQLYYPDNVKDLPSLHRLSSFQYVEETSKPTMYSLSVKEANTGTANNGVKLSKEQQEYFKDSKATDENGNLITVYHTTTDAVPQFNEFNPVGTPYYRFGDQVVNYYTNSKDMSGSYASQDYKMADTKKLNNVEDAKKYMEHISKLTGNVFDITQRGDNKFYATQDKQISKEARNFIEKLSETEKQQMLDNIYEDEKMKEFDPNYSRVFSWTEFDKDLLKKYNQLTDKYIGTADVVALQQEVMKYLESPVLLHEDARFNGEIIGVYDTEEEMLKNIKTDMQKSDWSKNSKIQYEGYVNITNPYIVDAEERNWNQVIQESNDFIDELEERVPQDVKDNLTRLYQESANKSAEARENYDVLEQVIRQGISGYNSSVDENIKKVNEVVKRVGFNEVEDALNDGQMGITGVSGWYNLAESLEQNGLIGSATRAYIIDEFKLPNQVKELLQENYTKEIPIQQIQTNDIVKVMNQVGRKTTLKELYSKNMQNYNEFDRYRMPNSYFLEQIASEGNDYLGDELNDLFETRAEIYSPEQVGEEIAQASSVAFSKPEMIRLWGTSKTTNDVVKEIIASNKDGKTNYDGVIIKNVYDYGGHSATGTQANDLYITFNSNQFKAVDNTTPTDDPDIRYRLSNKNGIAPISNNDIRARDMLLPRQQEIQKAIAPIQEENKVLKQEVETLKKEVRDIQENNAISYEDFEEYNKRIAPLLEEQEAPPEVEQVYDNLKDTTRMPKKEVKLLSKNIKDTLGLTNKQKLDLEEIIQDYSTSETATREDLYNDIKQRYGKQAIITEYEDIRNVQTKVKSMKLNVSDNIKHDIADYNMLKQKNFGKLSFSRNGQPVDSVYQELSSEYPNYFPSNIYNETDQFLKIVDVANLENKSVEELNLDDNYIRETSDYIYESILDSKQDAVKKAVEKISKESLQGELKAPLPVSFDTSDIDANNVVDEVRLMEHKARKKSQVDKGNGKRAPFDWSTFEEVGRKLRAGEDANSIAELNKLDAEAANKQIEEQKKLKPKNESTLRKSLTYGQYLFTNRNVEIDNYAKETGNHNIQVLADQVNNIQTEISTNINDAQTDNNLNTIGKSITQIFDQADKAGLSEAFNDYLFHLSNIERHKWGKGSQVPGIDSSILIEEYEKTYPEMKKWAKEVNKYNKNLLYKQADAGLITKDLADNLSKMYEFYVPFMENLEGEYTPDKNNSIKTRSTVKRAKGGSSRNLLNFEDAMIRQTETAISQIRKNQLYQEIVKTKENEATTDFESNTNPDVQGNGLFNDNGKYYLTAYVDGKATQVEIDKSLYHGLAQEGNKRIRQAEQKLSPITKPLQSLSNARRNILTTWSPTFLITNPLKDMQDAPLNSKYAKDWSKNIPRSIKEISSGKGGIELENFLNGYGQANLRGDYNLDSGLADVTKIVDKKSNNKGINISKKMLKKIPQINEKIELIPRYAEYLASLENGCSKMEALYNAREVTTNFGRGGIVTKALNRNGFTFLNANVQGMSKLVRNFSGENGGRAVLGCIAKATTLGIAPALLNALFFDDDDDYDVIPDYIKDNYYLIRIDKWNDDYDKSGNIIKGGGSAFLRIPKGRMMSIFGSAARRTLEGIQGRENPYEGYLSNAYNQVGVQNPLESNIFAPLIQAKNNKTWYGTDLVPKRLQTNKEDGTKIPAKQQYDASTDKFSIWLGDKLNISPYKINYVLDQYSGGVGDMVLPTITEEAQSDKDSIVGKMVAPLKDKFTADSITDNKYVTNFYSKLEELGEKKNATGSKKDEMSYNYMRNISFEMGSLYAEMRKVQADTTLKDSKKYAKVQNIKAEINRLAEEGMKGYKDVETYDNYARVGDRELYKYQSKDGKTGWSDSSGMYADDINNLGLSIKEKDTYYTTKMEMSNVANKFKEDEGAEKYRAVLKTIGNSKLPSDAKYELYNSWYGKSDETSSIVQDLGISANDYLKFKTADLSSTKNKNGYAVRGSKADKVISYLNKTKLSKGQKAVLYRLAFNYKGNYSSSKYSNAYNEEIVNYIDNSSLTYDESVDALKKLGFKVSKDGTVKWD